MNELTPQAWCFVVIGLVAGAGVAAIILAKAYSAWKRALRE